MARKVRTEPNKDKLARLRGALDKAIVRIDSITEELENAIREVDQLQSEETATVVPWKTGAKKKKTKKKSKAKT